MLKETLKQIEESFEETFLKRPYEEGIIYTDGKEVKNFITNSNKKVIEAVIEMVEKENNRLDNLKESTSIYKIYNSCGSVKLVLDKLIIYLKAELEDK